MKYEYDNYNYITLTSGQFSEYLATLKSVKYTINYVKIVKIMRMLIKYYLKWW